MRLVHVSSDHDQEGGEGHVSNDQNWRRMDVNGNVPSEADDRFAKMISDKVTERLGIGSDKTLKTVIVEAIKEMEAVKQAEEENVDPENWLESETHFTCETCTILSVLEIPHHLRGPGSNRANFGTVSKGQAKFHWNIPRG